ncbi:MAG: F0F1 ATP synthase subunit A [Thermodesulfobacteriota bacterium]
MQISPDLTVYCRWGPFALNATIVNTWVVMALLAGLSWLATRKLSSEEIVSPWQNLCEAIILYVDRELDAIVRDKPASLLPFVATLFLFVGLSNLLTAIPWWSAPTGSLSTTAGLALCVFVAAPLYGVRRRGLLRYLRSYLQPSPFMLPLNVFGEVSRTLAMAVRLFGNVMSGNMMGAILLLIAPFIVPVPLALLGLLTAMVHAYIFAVLAAVFIGAGLENGTDNRN